MKYISQHCFDKTMNFGE